MLVNSKNIRGIDNLDDRPAEGNLKYAHALMHTAVASPQEMEKRWKKHKEEYMRIRDLLQKIEEE
ncbi:MAG: hypothetical protein LBD60_01880 [Puniceicoccales bacterium]|jgi:hypothetical protein|nr:hypothetical protein [Puniceicoccales bacterium]